MTLAFDCPRPSPGPADPATAPPSSAFSASAASAPASASPAPASPGSWATEVEELVREHLPLVGYLVREVAARVPAHVHRDDLVSAAMFALAASAKSFDASVGTPFARFATIRIRGALTDELRTMDWASRGVRGKARQLDSARTALTQTIGRIPTQVEVARTMGVTSDELAAIERDVHRASVLRLQAISADDGADIVPERADGPEALLLRREQLGYLRDAVTLLPERLRSLVEQYFFEQRKMADIAADLGVTESRVSQLRSEALVMLRMGMQAADAEPEHTSAAASAQPVTGPSAKGRTAAGEIYRAGVAARSTVTGRLAASTLLGHSVAELRRAPRRVVPATRCQGGA